ncbi:AraC family transcriptional regulator [Paracoccus binzhouensis]|uniref:AraC family transcriptional regulator n=1 Tax=Paracoccus binzhouensis TaxID=2796149 RepID=UPI0018EF2D14|nr:AraC family transcriptional regulator [Paracoccus binzhouensis]
MSGHALPISTYLARSPHAQMLGHLDLGFGCSATLWRNRDARISYDEPQGHTLSFYTRGGQGTRRLDRQGEAAHGWPGAVCLMPHGHASNWEITESFEFIHLHLPDDELRRSFAQICERDSRLMQLADLTYVAAPELAAPFQALHGATRRADRLAAEAAMHELLGRIFTGGRYVAPGRRVLTGGLAPRRLRLVLDHIEANLAEPIQLRDLAALAGLSAFHFQRSFRASCGVSPHRWITARRIERARRLLGSGAPLARIALDCGFDSQSHFTRVFKAAMGLTPGGYRAALGGARPPRAT